MHATVFYATVWPVGVDGAYTHINTQKHTPTAVAGRPVFATEVSVTQSSTLFPTANTVKPSMATDAFLHKMSGAYTYIETIIILACVSGRYRVLVNAHLDILYTSTKLHNTIVMLK